MGKNMQQLHLNSTKIESVSKDHLYMKEANLFIDSYCSTFKCNTISLLNIDTIYKIEI